MRIKAAFLFFAVLLGALLAHADPICYLLDDCTRFRRDSSASPSPGTQLKINPSAVPTEKGYGVEGIYYDQEVDLSLVRGNGRMGAAISPSNSEETILGAPGFESFDDLEERKEEKKKYPRHKVTLATAFELLEKKGSGFKRYSVKLGVMGKYNQQTYAVTPGGGLNVVWGPFSAGYSAYDDETLIPYDYQPELIIKYRVQTYNVSFFLSSLILNYSNLGLRSKELSNGYVYVSTVHLYTASVTSGKFIFTSALRREDSEAPAYNYETKQLEPKKIKDEYFGGVQYAATKNIMVGALYNYYLLREVSATATLFF